MNKEARELRAYINDKLLYRYPTVSTDIEEVGPHRVKIILKAPNGRSRFVFAGTTDSGCYRDNCVRDVKQALRDLNMATDKEDITMAAIQKHNSNGHNKRVVHALKDIGKAHDLNDAIDTAPREAKLQVNGTPFITSANGRQVRDLTEAQKLRDSGMTLKEISQRTGIPFGTLGGRLKAPGDTPAVAPVPEAPAVTERKQRASPRRKTQENVFKISMHLSTRCSLVEEMAVYEEGWSDAVIATTVGNGCEADDVKELRIKHIGKMVSEIPKSHLNPEPYQLVKRIQQLEAKFALVPKLIENLEKRLQLIEDAVTKP